MELSDGDRAAFGRAMGMKAREILGAEEVAGGYVVTTHDHQRTFVDEFGRVGGAAPAVPAPVVAAPPAVPEEPSGPQPPGHGGEQTPDGGKSDGGGAGGGPVPEGGQVPDGSEREVLAWVDGDQERAAAALRAEEARETPRKGLLGKLQQLAG